MNYFEFVAAVMDEQDINHSTIREAFSLLNGEKQDHFFPIGASRVV